MTEMRNIRWPPAFWLLIINLSLPGVVAAQQLNDGRLPLQPVSRTDRIIAPFLEGFYVNDDGSITYSFGYMNINETTVEIPIGESNLIEPAEFAGMQPTVFLPGRHRGMFAVTVPASMAESDVWWTITNPNGRVTRQPGRISWDAYRLDWRPRAHGSVPPQVTFDGGQRPIGSGRGPAGVMAERMIETRVGAPATLSVNVKDISVRSPTETDPKVMADKPTKVRVVWTVYQAPVGATVDFSRHEATPVPAEADSAEARGGGGSCYSAVPCVELPEAQIIEVPSGEGTVHVRATFQTPGEYLIHAQVDNWGLPDSTAGDQCCWTNGYVRVTVRPT
jgi:hypothetical protein